MFPHTSQLISKYMFERKHKENLFIHKMLFCFPSFKMIPLSSPILKNYKLSNSNRKTCEASKHCVIQQVRMKH